MKDDIDLATVTILDSPNVRAWPATATFTKLALRTTGVHVEFTKESGAGSWPDVSTDTPGDSIEYTLWIFLHIGGAWYGAGCIEYWRGLDENGGPPQDYAVNWYYDPNRWAPMTGHQPAVGELVGFMMSAGQARNRGPEVVEERSNIVTVAFPSGAGAVFTWDAGGGGPVTPPTAPPTTPPDWSAKLIASINGLQASIDGLRVDLQRVVDKAAELQQTGVKVHL